MSFSRAPVYFQDSSAASLAAAFAASFGCTAASILLIQVFMCVCAAAARFSAFVVVELSDPALLPVHGPRLPSLVLRCC